MTDPTHIDLSGSWLFVDDDPNSAKSYAARLSEGANAIALTVLPPSQGRVALLTGNSTPLGVLMDVDLTGEPGEHGTGLGIAQDIRARQKARKINEFPIIRFANIEPVKINIGGDPSSDDLFDDKMDKGAVGRNTGIVQRRLIGVAAIYDHLKSMGNNPADSEISNLFSLDEPHLSEWTHPGLMSRLTDGMRQAIHVAAGAYLRSFLMPTGLLMDRKLLLMRMGTTQESGEKSWDVISKFADSFKFRGLGSEHYERWWARGLEEAWDELEFAEAPIAMTSATDRTSAFANVFDIELEPLQLGDRSPGTRPWRWCTLRQEEDPPSYVPVDPRFGVKISPRVDVAPWIEPAMASIGAAVRKEQDARLNRTDIERLVSELS
ncbi:hypothetical protein LPJGGPFB_02535 [Ensifer adhaerens]|uniref:hypothetical protein n=1 Tax=Ensifer adhaerens TaxID=106592 RepID=UPI001569A76E|nr:hypothetical protein [Ensifer adhaerens]NRP19280.1 hypothetical protein [Ensifer adhaerens]